MRSHRISISKSLRNDIILLAVLVVAALVLFPIVAHSDKAGSYALVELDGAEYARLDLDKDTSLTVSTGQGTNIIIVRDHAVSVESADCPDKICVRKGKLHRKGDSAVCLPAKTVITVRGGGLDAVTY